MEIVDAIFTGDIHFSDSNPVCRTDDYLSALTEKLKFIYVKALQFECDIYDCGDFLNQYSVNPNLEKYIYRFFTDKTRDERFTTIYGNHDLPYHSFARREKGSLGLLKETGAIKVLEEPSTRKENSGTICNYYPGHYGIGFEMPEKVYGQRNILILHEMISKEPEMFDTHNADKMLETFGEYYDLIVSGHNHQFFTTENKKHNSKLVNVGSLMRRTAEQIDYIPKLIKYNAETNTLTTEDIPMTKDVIDISYLTNKKERDERIESFIKVLKNNEGITLNFEKNINIFCEKNKIENEIIEKIKRYI